MTVAMMLMKTSPTTAPCSVRWNSEFRRCLIWLFRKFRASKAQHPASYAYVIDALEHDELAFTLDKAKKVFERRITQNEMFDELSLCGEFHSALVSGLVGARSHCDALRSARRATVDSTRLCA